MSETALRATIRDKVAAAGTSFYWAMRLLPEARRAAMYAIYAFCREVDDIADSDARAADKRVALDEWRHEIDAIFAGTSKLPLGRVLAEDVARFNLRRVDFLAIMDGMEMDARREWRSAGSRCGSLARRRRRASGLQQNSAGRSSSPAYLAISPKTRDDTGSTCLASYCTYTAYLQPRRAGCWRSRRSPTSARTWLCSLKDIMWPPPRQLLLALAGRCGPPLSCSGFIGPFSTSSSRVAGGSLTSQYESLPGANSPS
ncbi:MAG TPA: squalene/phytoene synthase family protein [Stellaceae bacterium]|nr:squalene/phytoene synthase family protein [Stellaceae bacterium]